jgi:hypothetical protein
LRDVEGEMRDVTASLSSTYLLILDLEIEYRQSPHLLSLVSRLPNEK